MKEILLVASGLLESFRLSMSSNKRTTLLNFLTSSKIEAIILSDSPQRLDIMTFRLKWTSGILAVDARIFAAVVFPVPDGPVSLSTSSAILYLP